LHSDCAHIILVMPATLDGQLVVAISSRALFDFEEENRLFEAADDRAYMRLQLERVDAPAKPGVAFSLVNKLLAFNSAGAPRVRCQRSAWRW
jgi:5'-nucleotidase